MSVLSNDTATRALHTLWQAAGGYAAASIVVQEFAAGDSHDAKLALLTAGTAVAGAVLSVAKAQGVKLVGKLNTWLAKRKVPVTVDPAVIDAAVQKALADYKAKESVATIAKDVAKTAVADVSVADPYLASPTK